jgi:pyridoxal biosynthesis lyase PdxS
LLDRQHRTFLEHGNDGIGEIQEAARRLKEIRAQVAEAFPMSDTEVQALQGKLAAQISGIADLEQEAIESLQQNMS